MWRSGGGDDLYAEVLLPEATREAAGRFGIHPALLDAALHPGRRARRGRAGAAAAVRLAGSTAERSRGRRAAGAADPHRAGHGVAHPDGRHGPRGADRG
ncbi:hypothetical protein NKH77_47145 [Streptomyces sp. M19]